MDDGTGSSTDRKIVALDSVSKGMYNIKSDQEFAVLVQYEEKYTGETKLVLLSITNRLDCSLALVPAGSDFTGDKRFLVAELYGQLTFVATFEFVVAQLCTAIDLGYANGGLLLTAIDEHQILFKPGREPGSISWKEMPLDIPHAGIESIHVMPETDYYLARHLPGEDTVNYIVTKSSDGCFQSGGIQPIPPDNER